MWKRIAASTVGTVLIVAWLFPAQDDPQPQTLAAASTAAPATPQKPTKCSPADFEIIGFKPSVFDDCRASKCPALKLVGKIRNNCARPAGAKIQITAYDKGGDVIDTAGGWPSSTRNIAPGDSLAFNLGPLMTYRSSMASFDARVVDVQMWRD